MQLNKLPSTNTNAYRAVVRSYLAQAISTEDRERLGGDDTESGAIQAIWAKYREEEGTHPEKGYGTQAHIAGWIAGSIDLPAYDDDIIADALMIHGLDPATELTDRLRNVILEGFFVQMALVLLRNK